MSSAVIETNNPLSPTQPKMTLLTAQDLWEGAVDGTYTIMDVVSSDEKLKSFLFSLGCYKGEEITILSRLADNIIITIKDARYSIDSDLAKAIRI